MKVDDYKFNCDKNLVLVSVFLYVFIFVFLDKTNLFNAIHQYCFGFCSTKKCEKIKQLRDSNYYLSNGTKEHPLELKERQGSICYFTAWELSHFLFHIYLGYYYGIVTSSSP